MPAWMSGDVIANGLRLHYTRTGGAKPPVVLLHGMTDNGLCWARVARRLEAAYDLIMLDARGHGLSDAPDSGYTAEDHAPDVAGVVRALGLERPVLIGHSMGAATAAATAAHFPGLVRAAILEDPPWGGPPNTQAPEQRAARVAAWRADIVRNKTRPRADLIAAGRRRNPAWDESEFETWAEAKQQVSANVATDIAGRGIRWQDVASRITCPVLLITADPTAGAIVTPETAQEALGLCPTLTVAPIAGAGHNIRREQFDSFVETVTTYLQTIIA